MFQFGGARLAFRSLGVPPKELPAKRRRQREGHDRRNENRSAQGHGEFAEQTADQSAHKENRNEDCHQGEADGNHREADLFRAGQCRLARFLPLVDVPHDVFDHDDGVIDQKSHRHRESHQGNVIEAESAKPHDGECPRQGQRNGDTRDEGRPEPAQEERHDHDHQRNRQKEGKLDIVERSANGLRAIAQDAELHAGRQPLSNLRQQGANLIDHGNDIGVRLLHHREQDRPLIVKPSSLPGILRTVDDVCDRPELHGKTIAFGHDERAIVVRAENLIVRGDHQVFSRVFDASFRNQPVRALKKCANVLHAHPHRGESRRIYLHAHRGFRASVNSDLTDTRQLAQALRNALIGQVENFRQAHRLRSHRENDHRRIGRIVFAIGRRVREVRGKIARGGVDRGLHISRRVVNVSTQIELHGDRGTAQRACRCHLGHAGDLSQTAFERSRERARRCCRVHARQRGAHADRREVDLRKRGDGQEEIRGRPEQQQADGEKRGAHRATDERTRHIHGTTGRNAAEGCPTVPRRETQLSKRQSAR